MKKLIILFLIFSHPLMADYPLLKKRTYTGVSYGELTSFQECVLYSDKKVKFTEVGTINSQEITPISISENISGLIEKASKGEVIPTDSESYTIYKAFKMQDGGLIEIPLKGRGAQGYINNARETLLLIHFLDLNC